MQHKHFPTASAYYVALPQGLDSFPECQASTRLPHIILREYEYLMDLPGLPKEWRNCFLVARKAVGWLPEVHNVLLNHVIKDAYFEEEAVFLARNKMRIVDSFSQPSIRPLMRMTSPHLLILGASNRWRSYHRGSEMKVLYHEQKSCGGQLTFPAGLFTELMLADTRIALEASIEMTRHKTSRVQIEQIQPGVASFSIDWSDRYISRISADTMFDKEPLPLVEKKPVNIISRQET